MDNIIVKNSCSEPIKKKLIRGWKNHRLIFPYFLKLSRALCINVIFYVNHLRGKKNLIFEITSPADFWNVEPIWTKLRVRKKLRIYWSVLNDDITQIPWSEYLLYLKKQGIEKKLVIISQVTPKIRGADLHLSPVDWSSRIPHGDIPKVQIFHYLPMKYSMHDKMLNFNVLFFTGPPHYELYRRHFLKRNPGAEKRQLICKVGYPKLDALINRSYDEVEIKSRLGLDLSCPTIIYSPTWDKGASLRTDGVKIIETLARLKVNVVVKLHQMSLYPPEHVHGTGGVDWRKELIRLQNDLPNVFPVFDHNCNQYLVISDIMVTDVSGIAYEYAMLDRPLIFMDAPGYFKNNPQAPDKKLRKKIGIVVKTPAELPAAIQRSLDSPGEFSSQRKKFTENLLYNPGKSTDEAVRLILQFLAEGVKPSGCTRTM
jgi:CDP-Glycerol:Poly(glycerophosphate) glycerophosphotransferase